MAYSEEKSQQEDGKSNRRDQRPRDRAKTSGSKPQVFIGETRIDRTDIIISYRRKA